MNTVKVKCHYCGTDVEKPQNEYNRRIRLGKDKFYCDNSCSSKEKENLDRLKTYPKYDISQHGCKKDELSNFRWYMKVMKHNNRGRNRNWGSIDFDLQYLKNLWASQGGLCPFTGIKMKLRTHTSCIGNHAGPNTASIDRINNELGYVRGNIRYISLMANYARNNFSDEQLIEFCKLVAEHNKDNKAC